MKQNSQWLSHVRTWSNRALSTSTPSGSPAALSMVTVCSMPPRPSSSSRSRRVYGRAGRGSRSPVAWVRMTVDEVLLAAPRGFCAGVEMAIKALAWMVRVFDPPVYCYHEIVHNQLVVDRFRRLGVVFVDDVADVPEGAPLMLSAHGSAPEVVEA